MMMWGDDDCRVVVGVCLRRAELKRAVHETHTALDSAGSQAAHRVAERAYHRALYALANHHCVNNTAIDLQPAGDEDERCAERPRSATQENLRAVASDTPAGIDQLEKLIDHVCELYRRSRNAADIESEYVEARLVLRTKLLMLLANQTKPFHDRLEEAALGDR